MKKIIFLSLFSVLFLSSSFKASAAFIVPNLPTDCTHMSGVQVYGIDPNSPPSTEYIINCGTTYDIVGTDYIAHSDFSSYFYDSAGNLLLNVPVIPAGFSFGNMELRIADVFLYSASDFPVNSFYNPEVISNNIYAGFFDGTLDLIKNLLYLIIPYSLILFGISIGIIYSKKVLKIFK